MLVYYRIGTVLVLIDCMGIRRKWYGLQDASERCKQQRCRGTRLVRNGQRVPMHSNRKDSPPSTWMLNKTAKSGEIWQCCLAVLVTFGHHAHGLGQVLAKTPPNRQHPSSRLVCPQSPSFWPYLRPRRPFSLAVSFLDGIARDLGWMGHLSLGWRLQDRSADFLPFDRKQCRPTFPRPASTAVMSLPVTVV